MPSANPKDCKVCLHQRLHSVGASIDQTESFFSVDISKFDTRGIHQPRRKSVSDVLKVILAITNLRITEIASKWNRLLRKTKKKVEISATLKQQRMKGKSIQVRRLELATTRGKQRNRELKPLQTVRLRDSIQRYALSAPNPNQGLNIQRASGEKPQQQNLADARIVPRKPSSPRVKLPQRNR